MTMGAASAQSSQSEAASGALPWPASASVGRPDIGPEVDHGRNQRAAAGGDALFSIEGRMTVRMVAHARPGTDGLSGAVFDPPYRRIPPGNHPGARHKAPFSRQISLP